MGFYRGPKIVTDGLVLALDAANRKSYPGSGNDWYSLAGNNYSASLQGPSFITDNGGAIDFNATESDYASLPDIDTYSANAKFSIVTVVKAIAGNWGRIFTNGSNGVPGGITGFINVDILVLTSGSKPFLYLRVGNSLIFNTQISTINWSSNPFTMYFGLSVDKESNEGTYYIRFKNDNSGLIQSELTSTFTPGSATGFVENRLGGETDDETYSTVDIYSFSMYDRALSLSELQQNYNATKGRFDL